MYLEMFLNRGDYMLYFLEIAGLAPSINSGRFRNKSFFKRHAC